MTWRRIALRDIGRWYGGGTPSKSNDAFWRAGSVPWLSPKDMGAATLTATQDLISSAAVAASAVHLVPPVSIAVVVRSGILERKLPVALVPFETTLNQDMKAVVPQDGIDPRWVAWGLRAFERDLLRAARKAGTTVASIEMSRFFAFELPVPPLEKQQCILAVLEGYLSRLESAEQGLLASLKRLESMRLSVLTDEVYGVAETLGELALGAEYGTSTKCAVDGAGIAVARIPNIADGAIDMSDEKRAVDASIDLSRLTLRAGDLLIVRTNGSKNLIGRSAVVQDDMNVAFASYLIRYRFDERRVQPHWVRLALETPAVRAHLERLAASSAGQHNLGLKKLNAVQIPCPELDIQRASMDRIIEQTGGIAALKRCLRASQRRSAALRRGVLAAGFSGQLTGQVGDDDVMEEVADAQTSARTSE